MNADELLAERGAATLTLFEYVACAGEVRCARSLFDAFRAFEQHEADPFEGLPVLPSGPSDSTSPHPNPRPAASPQEHPARHSPPTPYENACLFRDFSPKTTPQPPLATHAPSTSGDFRVARRVPSVGCALHICCALGHVELFEYLLVQVAHSTSKHLNDEITSPSHRQKLPLLNILWCALPLDYAIAYDQVRVLGHLLAQVQDPPLKHDSEPLFRWENSHSLKLHAAVLHKWLQLSAFYNAVQCVQLLVEFCEQHPSLRVGLFPPYSQECFLVAAFRGPAMITLFDKFNVPQSKRNFWENTTLNECDEVPVYADAMRANFDYLKKKLLVGEGSGLDVLETELPMHRKPKKRRASGEVKQVSGRWWELPEQRALKAANIMTAWMRTYFRAFCQHGERSTYILPAGKPVARCEMAQYSCEDFECAHASTDGTSPDSISRADLLVLMDDLLSFDRHESNLRVCIELPPGEVKCPVVFFLFSLRFKMLLEENSNWPDGNVMSAANPAHAVNSLFELFMSHVVALAGPVRHVVYQLLFGSLDPYKLPRPDPSHFDHQKYLLLTALSYFGTHYLRLAPSFLSFWRRVVHFYGVAIKDFPAILTDTLHSSPRTGKSSFQIYPAINALQSLAYFLRPCVPWYPGDELFSANEDNDTTTPPAYLLPPVLNELFDVVRPISIRDVSKGIEGLVKECIPSLHGVKYRKGMENRFLFGGELFRLAVLASTLATARLLIKHFGAQFQDLLTCSTYYAFELTPIPQLLHIPSLLCWSQIEDALSGIHRVLPAPQSLRDIARNAVWVALLGGAHESDEQARCMRDRIDHLRLPAVLSAFLQFQ